MCFASLIALIVSKIRCTGKVTVQQVMLPVTICGWIVGMGIIEFPLGNPWPTCSFLYSLFLICGYGLLVRASVGNINAIIDNISTTVGQLTSKALFYGNVWLNVCSTLLSWIRIKRIKRVMERLECCDESIETIGIQKDYTTIFIRQLSVLVTTLSVVIIFIIIAFTCSTSTDFTIWEKMVVSIAAYYPVIMTSIADISFITFVRFVSMRFNQLNQSLQSMLNTTDFLPQHKKLVLVYAKSNNKRVINSSDFIMNVKTTTEQDDDFIKSAKECHLELIITSRMINDTFGVQILLSMTVTFILVTGLIYNSTSIVLSNNVTEKQIWDELITVSCWLIFYIFRIVMINASCAIASCTASRTGNIICQLHEPSTTRTFRNEIRDFTLQVIQNPLTFTACGFFTLDYGFIQRMISSITTYLVILIQIGDSAIPDFVFNTTAVENGTYTWNPLMITLPS